MFGCSGFPFGVEKLGVQPHFGGKGTVFFELRK